MADKSTPFKFNARAHGLSGQITLPFNREMAAHYRDRSTHRRDERTVGLVVGFVRGDVGVGEGLVRGRRIAEHVRDDAGARRGPVPRIGIGERRARGPCILEALERPIELDTHHVAYAPCERHARAYVVIVDRGRDPLCQFRVLARR